MEKIQLCQEIVDQIQAESKRPVCRLRLSREPFAIADSHLGGAFPMCLTTGKFPLTKTAISFGCAPRLILPRCLG